MSDKFTKQYVLDRIEARLGRLDLLAAADQTTLDDYRASQIGTLDAILEKNLDRIEAFEAKVKLAKKEYARAEDYVGKRKALEPITGHNALALESLPSTYRNSSRRAGEARTEADIVADLNAYRVETAELLHAKIYLEGMPVDEFSLASLRSLGLLQVLKFRLTDPSVA